MIITLKNVSGVALHVRPERVSAFGVLASNGGYSSNCKSYILMDSCHDLWPLETEYDDLVRLMKDHEIRERNKGSR